MQTNLPWYKQFWPWFLIILPSCAVLASINLLYIAIDNQDSLVSEDYYKDGKRINIDLRKIRVAKQLGLQFHLALTDNELVVTQHGGEKYLAALNIEFFHPTIQSRDFKLQVTASGDQRYRVSLPDNIQGSWEVRIDSFDHQWRIQQRLELHNNGQYWLN